MFQSHHAAVLLLAILQIVASSFFITESLRRSKRGATITPSIYIILNPDDLTAELKPKKDESQKTNDETFFLEKQRKREEKSLQHGTRWD